MGGTIGEEAAPLQALLLTLRDGTDGYKEVTIAGFDVDPPDLGYLNPREHAIAVLLPIRSVEAAYLVLRTEQSVGVEWEADDAGKLVYFGLAGPLPHELRAAIVRCRTRLR
jgi:hypothetical protein